MVKLRKVCLYSFAILALFSSSAFGRTVTDQLGKKVTVPDHITNAVVLQHQTLNLIVQLNAFDAVTGVLDNWKKQLGPSFARLAPGIEKLATPGNLTSVNIETLATLKPQVVFVTNYAPTEMIEQIEGLHIPVVAVSLRESSGAESAKLNPTMQDEETAYNTGLKNGILLIGEVMGRTKEAQELIDYSFSKRKLTEDRLKKIPQEKRIATYMANPDLTTYGSGKYTGLMMAHAGAMNVAAASIKGYKQVSMEQILTWNPEVIFVQDRYPSVVEEITTNDAWKPIKAVKNKRVYLMPEYAKAWGYPEPEAIAIGELWMAKKLYPELFSDIDMQKEADAYYTKFYRVPYADAK